MSETLAVLLELGLVDAGLARALQGLDRPGLLLDLPDDAPRPAQPAWQVTAADARAARAHWEATAPAWAKRVLVREGAGQESAGHGQPGA